MENRIDNNQVKVSGRIVSCFEFSHEVYGEKFYSAKLASERLSGQIDVLPILVSGKIVDVKKDWVGRFVEVSGQFRSYNQHTGDKSKLVLSVFAKEFKDITEDKKGSDSLDDNEIILDGYICKQPIYRKTPLGREISDILIAVNRSYGKTDYIPSLAWGRNARFVSDLEVGTRLQITGRIQSREYQKKISEGDFETRTAYEVSVSKIELVEVAEDDCNEALEEKKG